MDVAAADASECEYVQRPALYYCISYDLSLLDEIKTICLNDHRFTDLGNDKREIDNGKNIFFRSTNSDKDNCATRGFIAVDELTIEGDDFMHPEEVFLEFEPAECLKKEKMFADGINFITDLYDLIISVLKKKKIKFEGEINLGWVVMSCTWEDGPESESSEDNGDDKAVGANDNNATGKNPKVKATKAAATKTVAPKKSAPSKKTTQAKKPKKG
jgi:hypothetical protein